MAKIKDIVTAPGVANTSPRNCGEVFYSEALMLVKLKRGASTDAQTLKRRQIKLYSVVTKQKKSDVMASYLISS